MSRSIEFSKFDVEQKYTVSDIVPFTIDARVENNELIITDTVGNDTNVGQYQGGIGDEVVDLQLNNGSLQQFYNNGVPSTFHGEVKRDRSLTYDHSGIGYFTGETVDDLLSIRQDESDIPIIIDGSVLYHIVPTELDWIQPVNNRILLNSNEGVTIQVNRRASSSTTYDLHHTINRNQSSTTRFQWSTSVSVSSADFYTMEFPYPIEMSGFRFKSYDSTYFMDEFSVELSADGFSYDTFDTYTQTNVNYHIPLEITYESPILVKKVRIKPISSPRSGSIKFFDPLTADKPNFRRTLQYKPITFDQRFYEVEEGENDSRTIAIRNDLETSLLPYETGTVMATRYTKMESTTAPIRSTTYDIDFNQFNKNGARASLHDGQFTLRKGVYLVKGMTVTRGSVNAVLSLRNMNTGSLISSGLFISTSVRTFGSTRAGSEFPVLRDIIKLDEDTTLKMECTTTRTTETLGSLPISDENSQNIYGTMEIWALNNDDFFLPDPDDLPLDNHWDNVVLLLNGHNAWTDHSKHKGLVLEMNGVKSSPSEYGYGASEYDFTEGRSDIILSTSAYENMYQPNNSDFTFEFSFNTFDNMINQILYHNGVTGNNRSYVEIENGRVNIFDNQNSGYIFDLPDIPELGTEVDGQIITVNDLELADLNNEQLNSVIISGNWYHVSWCRQDGTHYLYINGVLISTNDDIQFNTESEQYIFGNSVNGDRKLLGRMRNIRMTIGANRYTSNFEPPSIPFTKYYEDKLND